MRPGPTWTPTYPAARIGERLFRGSGTSQAAAVVSGAAALLIQQRPNVKPDQVKALLMGTAATIPGATAAQQGSGLIDLATAKDSDTPQAIQSFKVSTGVGSLEASRGSVHVTVDGRQVTGEVDVRGRGFDVRTWAAGLKHRRELERHELVRDVVVRHDLVRDVVVRHELVRDVVVRHDLVRNVLERHVVVRDELVWDVMVRHELVRDVLVRHELVVRR